MAACRKLLLPSMVSVLFCFSLLSANVEERSAEGPLGQGLVRGSDVDDNGVKFDDSIVTVAADSSRKSRVHPSNILPRHQALIFDPPSLDFREHSVGMPKLKTVTITNPSSTQPLQLTSISGDSPTFHASFFRSKVVKAGESTSFDVVFLARVMGSVRNVLYIQSSQGTFEYEVQGVGAPNPFRLHSLLGARIPLNATYSPQITMYNPFSQPLQITEMYSSSSELHLELLTGQSEGAKALWEIRPYETKTIARASFFGAAVANHTSFVRVKTDHESSPSVVLPVEVEVSDQSGLFLSRELLDFGVVKGGETKVIPLYVLNTGQQQVHVKNVSISPKNDAIEIEYMTTLLRPGSKYTKIALLKLYADRVSSKEQMRGEVVVRGEDRVVHQVVVPYEACVLMGSLSYDKESTLFRPDPPPFSPVLRQISLSNHFESPVVVYDAKLPSRAQEYFAVSTQETPFILSPSTEWEQSLSVVFLPSSTDCFFNTTLRLSTNATYFNIPLICYDGRVKYSLENPDEDALEFGVLSQTDVVTKTFTLHNINPVQISIDSYSVSSGLPFTQVQLHSVHHSNSTRPVDQPPAHSSPPHTLEPEHSAVFSVTVSHPDTIGTYSGEVYINTSFDRTLHVPVYFKTSESRLRVTPEAVDFGRIFPYLRSKVAINVKNLCHRAVDVTSVNPDLNDPRVYFEESVDGLPRLKPMEKIEIGSVILDPLLGGSDAVYLSKPESSSNIWQPHSSSRDPSREVLLWSSLWSTWQTLVEEEQTLLNLSVVVSSDVGGEVRVPTTASLVWPDLVGKRVVTLTPTVVGNTSTHRLQISNPSDQPLLVQPVFLSHYTHPQIIIDSLLDRLDPRLRTLNLSLSANYFSFVASSDNALVTSLLPPHTSEFEIEVAFSPKVDQESNVLLLLRNNLTVFDYIVVQGVGVQGPFAIDSIQPGTEPLKFEFPNSVLENCLAGTVADPNVDPLKLTKAFRMHNSGSTSIVLKVIGLEGGACEGHGFTISNCHKDITIKPNRSKRIEITFTPDYTLTQVSNTLHIQTSSGNKFLYPLLAILPHQLLAACIALQPRPELEKTLAWFSVPFWLFVILSIMATVFVQTKLGLKSGPVAYQTEATEVSKREVFDLKNLTKSVEASLSKKIQELEEKSINEASKLVDQPEKDKDSARSEPHKPAVDSSPPIVKAESPTTSTTTQETPKTSQLRFRHIANKPDKDSTIVAPVPTAVPQSNSLPPVISAQKGKPLKIPVVPLSDSTVDSSTRTSTDNHTGVREQLQPPCTPTTGAPSHISSSVLSKPKRSEKLVPDKAPPKAEVMVRTPTDTAGGGTQSQSSRRSRTIRKISSKSRSTPEISPLSPMAVKELERKASESSIISTDSTSTSTDKSEDSESPSSQVTHFLHEVKKLPPPPAKEPNTGQTIHPPETPDAPENSKPELSVDAQKKESVASPPLRLKGKKKTRQQQKKEEKARKKEREERNKEKGKERERDREKEVEHPDTTVKLSQRSLEDSSSSISVEQLEEDSGSPPPLVEDPVTTEVSSGQVDKSLCGKVPDTTEKESCEMSVSPPLVAPAVPSTAIKTGRAKSVKQLTKEASPSDPFPRVPERTTHSNKKTSSKKPLEKKPPVSNSGKSTPPIDDVSEPGAEQSELSDSPRQRPQTLPVIKTESVDEPPPVETSFDSGSLVETDGVAQTLLAVESSKNSAQSLPTSPHELAASLLSKNSIIKRRRHKSDRDKPGEGGEDEEEPGKPDEQEEIESKQPIEPEFDDNDSPTKEESSPHSNQFKPLSTTLSLDAEPFYPSPNYLPSKSRPSARADSRKYPGYNQHPRHHPPAFSPTSDDPFATPYQDPPYFKNLPRPTRMGSSLTPSPPLPYGAFPDGGQPMPYGDFPSSHDPREPSIDDPYFPSEELPPPPPVGRYGEHYRGRSPMITSKGVHNRPSVESYMLRQHQQQLAQHHRAMKEYGNYPMPGSWDKSHGMKPPSMDEVMYQQYLRKRHYLTSLIQREKAFAALEREQRRRSVDTANTSVFGPEAVPPTVRPRPWDTPEFNESAYLEDVELMRQRQSQLLLEPSSVRPSRSRTYSIGSDLGGELVSDFPTPSAVGAPGQQVTPRGESSSSTSLAPGRSKSSGWPSGGQVSSSKWDSPWSVDSPFYSGDSDSQSPISRPADSAVGQRSLSENNSQTFPSSTYDLFKEQSIWSLSNSDNSLLSWTQLKPDHPESKTE